MKQNLSKSIVIGIKVRIALPPLPNYIEQDRRLTDSWHYRKHIENYNDIDRNWQLTTLLLFTGA